jgi:hypothetical protein
MIESTLTNYMNRVSVFVARDAYQEVVWLDVTIDQRLVVDRLYASNLRRWEQRSASVGLSGCRRAGAAATTPSADRMPGAINVV